ncbi:FBN2 [Branchiostoma lanceolatum]|uniref:FBN2 protein n=1 Tax=Branchiostoma lanceolatum TaxID=7740 RepID=A0A8J9ZK48_BRALA|nr:FBN2 [Branchiostoma lanceolatum]
MARLLYLLLLANMFNSSFQGGCPTVRISGSSAQSSRMTTYTMNRQLHDDRPVYRSSRGEYLYHDRTDSTWNVGTTVGSTRVGLYVVDSSTYADSIIWTWYEAFNFHHIPNSRIRARCDNPFARVNGQWSNWGSWSSCTRYCICGNSTCVPDTVTRRRRCITPPPLNGGSNCAGSSTSTRDCACRDINECLDDTLNNCDLDNGGSCVNTQGSFHCTCDDGYNIQADGRTCLDIDECADNSTSCVNGLCTNTIGSYNCTCNSGYRKNPSTQNCAGLSIGAIVGISLGAAAAVLITAVVFYCCCCKKSGSVATAGHAWPVNETSP